MVIIITFDDEVDEREVLFYVILIQWHLTQFVLKLEHDEQVEHDDIVVQTHQQVDVTDVLHLLISYICYDDEVDDELAKLFVGNQMVVHELTDEVDEEVVMVVLIDELDIQTEPQEDVQGEDHLLVVVVRLPVYEPDDLVDEPHKIETTEVEQHHDDTLHEWM